MFFGSSEGRRRHTQSALDKAREIRGRAKGEILGDFLQRNIFLSQKPRDFLHGKKVDKVTRTAAACLAADFGKIVRRHEEALRVPLKLSMLPVASA